MAIPTMGDAGVNEGDSDISPVLSMDGAAAMETLSIVLILIALTIIFEKIKHYAEHAAGRALRPIVDALFGELTVLGFLSAITYTLEKAGLFLALSRLINEGLDEDEEELGGEVNNDNEKEEENDVFELVESIHFGMFFVMVVFMVSTLAEVHNGVKNQKEWCQWDRACQDEAYVQNLLRKNASKEKEDDAISSMRGFRGMTKRMWRFLMPYLHFLPFLRDQSRESLEDKMEFCSLRLEFFKERSSEPPFAPAGDVEGGPPKTIGDHCNFGRYLTFSFGKKMTAVVEIDVKTWIFFAAGAVCYYSFVGVLGFSQEVLAWMWVLIGWIFYVLSINFEKYLLGIRDQFMASTYVPKPRLLSLSWRNLDDANIGTEKEPLRYAGNGLQNQKMKAGEELPVWCHVDLDEFDRKRSRLVKAIFGPTPRNRQHAIYLFGPNGPAFHTFFLRVMLVFSCVYSARLVTLFVPMLARDENTTIFVFIAYCVLALIPALAFIFNRKRTMVLLVQVGCIGSFILPQSIAESEREEKTSMAVRVLVIFFKFARMTNRFLADPSLFQVNRSDAHYTEVLSSEEIAELGRIFISFFDDSGDGFLSEIEFQELMSTVGIIISDKEANELVKAILKSTESDNVAPRAGMDGEMLLSKEAFFQWHANQLGDQEDIKECAEFLFSMFDDDNSGEITVLEFKQQLDNLAIGITSEEAYELIQQMDEDGNGVLCEKEFEDMVEHFYPVEFQHKSENWD